MRRCRRLGSAPWGVQAAGEGARRQARQADGPRRAAEHAQQLGLDAGGWPDDQQPGRLAAHPVTGDGCQHEAEDVSVFEAQPPVHLCLKVCNRGHRSTQLDRGVSYNHLRGRGAAVPRRVADGFVKRKEERVVERHALLLQGAHQTRACPRSGQIHGIAIEQLLPAAHRERAAHDCALEARTRRLKLKIMRVDTPAVVLIEHVHGHVVLMIRHGNLL